tara:strand:+ start:393 stop:1193 length:801 start_codon:yes stop_codon:yes gene_type:complete
MFHNVGGVTGFSILLDAISPDLEYLLFNDKRLFTEDNPKKKHVEYSHRIPNYPDIIKNILPELIFKLLGNYPIPDICVPLSYPIDSAFNAHFDSRHIFGEYIMVLNLGEKAKLYLTPGQHASKDFKSSGSKIYKSTPGIETKLCLGPKSFSIEVEIPPRSAYVMKRDARYIYQHGIRKQSVKNIGSYGQLSWNTNRLRRCLVFRTFKAYNDIWLEDQFREDSENIDIYERLTIAKNYHLELENGKKANKKEIELERMIAKLKLLSP